MATQKVTIKMAQEINEMYDDGMILKEIAEEKGLSITTIGMYRTHVLKVLGLLNRRNKHDTKKNV